MCLLPIHEKTVIEVKLQNFYNFVDFVIEIGEHCHCLDKIVAIAFVFDIDDIEESEIFLKILIDRMLSTTWVISMRE